MAQNKSGRQPAVPDEIVQIVGDAISQRKRKWIEQGFGSAKAPGAMHEVMVCSLAPVAQMFVPTMPAYNLVVRMRSQEQMRPQAAH